MDILLLDNKFEVVKVIDLYESLIWTVRYDSYGDFELYTAVTDDYTTVPLSSYLQIPGSDQIMVVEERLLNTDVLNGNYLTIKGRTLSSILSRRVVWRVTKLNGNLQTELNRVLNENVISPSDANRKIPNFVFKQSMDPIITALTIKRQITGISVYKLIEELCDLHGLGFKVTLNASMQMELELYSGDDRSYEQLDLPYVIFSPEFENLMASNHMDSILNYSNMAYVAGEDLGTVRAIETIGEQVGLERWELFVDARDLQTETDGQTISASDYAAGLIARGHSKLKERKHIQDFEGEVEDSHTFTFGEDYFLGDKVQVVNEYGLDTVSRVGEVTIVMDTTGFNVLPTFKIIKERTDET